jgi:lipoprotein-anchoring transpeptidase ErfK/SrfK
MWKILLAFFMVTPAMANTTIVIDKKTQTMEVQSGEKEYAWPVSTARKSINPETQKPFYTPTGTFRPQSLQVMHYSKKYDNNPMPYSIFFTGGFAIHGTPYVGNLGHPASHGCVRLRTDNAKILYNIVEQDKNTKIIIK